MTRVSDVDAHATRTWRWVIVLGVLPVHLTTLLLTAGGLWLSLVGPPLTERGLGVLLLAAVYVARPRINKRPRYVAELTRVEAPRLFGLVTEVARVTDTAVPAEVLVLPDFNAFATQVGWRRTRVVGIGAPLWMACSSQQRVALLGHELSHFANKDTSYGLWVATALETLRGWYFTLNQRDSLSRGGERLIQMVLLKPVAALIAGHLAVINRVAGPPRQRQEYLADIGASRAAGTDAAIEMLDVLLSDTTVQTAITRSAVSQPRQDMWEIVAAAVSDRSPNKVQGRQGRRAAAQPDRRQPPCDAPTDQAPGGAGPRCRAGRRGLRTPPGHRSGAPAGL